MFQVLLHFGKELQPRVLSKNNESTMSSEPEITEKTPQMAPETVNNNNNVENDDIILMSNVVPSENQFNLVKILFPIIMHMHNLQE